MTLPYLGVGIVPMTSLVVVDVVVVDDFCSSSSSLFTAGINFGQSISIFPTSSTRINSFLLFLEEEEEQLSVLFSLDDDGVDELVRVLKMNEGLNISKLSKGTL